MSRVNFKSGENLLIQNIQKAIAVEISQTVVNTNDLQNK